MKQVLIAIDQFVNTLLGGYADETFSARAHRSNWVFVEKFINALFLDKNHCKDSYDSEMNRRQLPKDYSNGTQP